MDELKRKAEAVWKGDLKSGQGMTSASSEAFQNLEYSFATRFEHKKGTNPEEMIASAHASCFSMQLASILSKLGNTPDKIHTVANVTLRQTDSGFKVSRVHLETRGVVPGVYQKSFEQAAREAKETCPISVLLTPGLEKLSLDAKLL